MKNIFQEGFTGQFLPNNNNQASYPDEINTIHDYSFSQSHPLKQKIESSCLPDIGVREPDK